MKVDTAVAVPLAALSLYPGDPEMKVLVRLDVEAMGMSHKVLPEPGELPLKECVEELMGHLISADQIVEFQGIANALGIRAPTILPCDSLGGCLAAHFGDESGLDWEGPISPFIALNLPAIAAHGKLTPVDLVLHELTHQDFSEHGAQFATLLNWQRLRCGLPLLWDDYDARDSFLQAEPHADHVHAALALAHELAQALSVVDLDRSCVAMQIQHAFDSAHGIAIGLIPDYVRERVQEILDSLAES